MVRDVGREMGCAPFSLKNLGLAVVAANRLRTPSCPQYPYHKGRPL